MATDGSFKIGSNTVVFIDEDHLDDETVKQITAMDSHPSLEHIRVMPDCHKGRDCCIGLTAHVSDKIKPNFIGGDIGCGMTVYPIGELSSFIGKPGKREKRSERIDCRIKNAIVDRQIYIRDYKGDLDNSQLDPYITADDLNQLYDDTNRDAETLVELYMNATGIDISEYRPLYGPDYSFDLHIRTKYDFIKSIYTLGTIGNGNHFIEINEDSEGLGYISVHTGSRSLGKKICEFHQRSINEGRSWSSSNDTGKSKNERHPDYLEGESLYLYLFDMLYAQNYAKLNRRVVIKTVLSLLNINDIDESLFIESIHNYIDLESDGPIIMRKGAVKRGGQSVIALNMRDGIAIVSAESNEDWNDSLPHGCGRIAMRSDNGNKKERMRRFKEQMDDADVYTSSISWGTLDEAPDNYRDYQLVLSKLDSGCNIERILRPVINIKADSMN